MKGVTPNIGYRILKRLSERGDTPFVRNVIHEFSTVLPDLPVLMLQSGD